MPHCWKSHVAARIHYHRTIIYIYINCKKPKELAIKMCMRSGVRSAMRAASQLPGKGPTDVDDAPAPAC